MYISFVVPVMNEAGNVNKLHQEVVKAAKKIGNSFEIIFVDDGSTDNTVEVLKKLKPIKIIEMRRNFGQTAALDAGIKESQGKYLATLDGDLQNNPADIPKMLKKLKKEDWDVVCGWRVKRKDSFSKRFISKGARWLRSFLVADGIHDSGCTLRVYKKECFEDLNLRGEMHRFIPAILKWRGFKITEMPVDHRSREYGVTKYNFKRTVKGFLDMLSIWFFRKYESRPLHMLGSLGLLFTLIGTSMIILQLIARLFFSYSLSDKIWPLFSIFLILFGIQLFFSGLQMMMLLDKNSYKSYMIKNKTQL